VVSLFKEVLKSNVKHLEFTQKRLRGAKDIFKNGGHVTPVYKDQVFRMFHDNRRQVIEPSEFKGCDLSVVLFDSKPLVNVDAAKKLRYLSKFPYTSSYNKNDSNRKGYTYKSYLEIGVRNFIKGYVSSEQVFGLKGDEFKTYNDWIFFIYDFKSSKGVRLSLRISKQSI